jgi:rRNA maturation RNase YbeY
LILRFFFDDTDKIKIRKKELSEIADKIFRDNNLLAENINIILTSDIKLQSINKEFLNHTEYTDIITFENIEKKSVRGEIYISLERVKVNSIKYSKSSIDDELHRVIIHGILHLAGYNDLKIQEKKQMTQMEDYFLNELNLLIQPKK